VLADRANLSHSYIARLETEEWDNPTLEVFLKLLSVLEVPPAEFFAPFTEVVNPFSSE
jgi:transcriptional regulator with XRE-family HTH domain